MRLLVMIASLLPLAAQATEGQTVAQPSGCRIETRLDACRSVAEQTLDPAKYQWSSAVKSVETSLDAADTSVRATETTKSDAAQAAKPPVAPPAPAAQAPSPPTPPAAKADIKSDTSPVPVEESWLAGSIDVGYRWQSGVGGSFDT